MFTHYKTQGFILKKINLGETDQLFTIYTKEFGKLEVLGKAIRKISSKLRSGAEIFYLSEIEFIQGKGYKTLTDAILTDKFKILRKDLRRLNVAYKISEVLDDLIKGQEPDEKIWKLLQEVFEKLNSTEIKDWKLEILYYYFLWNTLSALGYQLELHNCVICQEKINPEDIFFSPENGGLVCDKCQKSAKQAKEINQNIVKILRIMSKNDWPTLQKIKIGPEELKLLKIISDYYFSEILEQIR